jgi:membrane associated rhomboid family serine protease
VSRRRRRERRERRSGGTTEDAAPKRAPRADEKRRAAFLAQQRSLSRRRTIVGALGFLPLLGGLGCGGGVELLCAVPQQWWLAIWAAVFGSFIGITIRLFLERRKFERGAAAGRSA